jgi:hypothetical protein
MTKILFEEPATGTVNGTDQIALDVKVLGVRSNGIKVTNTSNPASFAIFGTTTNATGVFGSSTNGTGVFGASGTSVGVKGTSNTGIAISGETRGNSVGVWGETRGTGDPSLINPCAGVYGRGWGNDGIGVLGRGVTAGYFSGDVVVTGDIKLLNSADCAEDFDISDSEINTVEPGTVMVLTETGSLQSSHQEYDKKVAGIVSGAGKYKPGIVLDSQKVLGKNKNGKERLPIALMGKVYCKVDARHASIEIGDLLTTSSTNGYAMKAQDPLKAFGAVIGKALRSIKEGRMGMIPVLVALQ